MKKIFIIVLAYLLLSCNKNGNNIPAKSDSTKIIESINVARTKYNDSIKTLNQKNNFGDLSGNHPLKFENDDATLSGKINFIKIGRDEYQVNGRATANGNKIAVAGNIKRVSEKHLNFEGRISQIINRKKYTRTRRSTFLNEGKGNFWRLQDKVNNDGFVDYIDIYH
ncbi:MAG: hypothetical protein J0L47_11140 [Flavobacteriales bacterium]|nr:hypothetical protein [Flavobacteriales bacterium]MCA0392342.1 hypothetical protein [Bacteroidota bacterium]